MLTEHLSQPVMEEVGRGVISPDRATSFNINRRSRHLASSNCTFGDARPVAPQVRQRESGVDHLSCSRGCGNGAGVTDLTTAFRVKRRAIEKDFNFSGCVAVAIDVKHDKHSAFGLI